jgi:hypothetical protein
MNQTIDLAITYKFLKNLVTPFDRWPAYRLGLIDKDGNIIKARRERLSQAERDALGYFDVVTLNLRKLLGKLPGGKSAIATYAAAYLLLKEYPKKNINEGYEPSEEEVARMLTQALVEIQEEQVVTNTTAGVAGLRPDSIGLRPGQMKKYKRRNQDELPQLRKRFNQFVTQSKG